MREPQTKYYDRLIVNLMAGVSTGPCLEIFPVPYKYGSPTEHPTNLELERLQTHLDREATMEV